MKSLYFLIPALLLSAYKANADETQNTSISKVTGVYRQQLDKSLADYYLAIAR